MQENRFKTFAIIVGIYKCLHVFAKFHQSLAHTEEMAIASGKGWYRYEKPGGKNAIPDNDIKDVIRIHCKELGIEQRQISTQVCL